MTAVYLVQAGSCTSPDSTGRLLELYARGFEDMDLVPVTFPKGLTNEFSCHHCILTLQDITQAFFLLQEMLKYVCFLKVLYN